MQHLSFQIMTFDLIYLEILTPPPPPTIIHVHNNVQFQLNIFQKKTWNKYESPLTNHQIIFIYKLFSFNMK